MFIIVSDVQYISLYTKTYQPLHFDILKIFSGEAKSVLSVLWLQMSGLVAFIEQKENDNNDCYEANNLQNESVLLYYNFPMEDSSELLDFLLIPILF